MTPGRPWATRLLRHRLRQPDARSCGAASLVVARALRDESYARLLVEGVHPVTGWALPGSTHERFEAETLAMHARVTSPVDVLGRLQLPWPRRLGTPPWAVARQLSRPGRRHAVRVALWGRARALAAVRRVVAAGDPAALFVGDRRSPRHVVLVVAVASDALRCYDPATGRTVAVTDDAFTAGRLPFGRWRQVWCVVLPREPR